MKYDYTACLFSKIKQGVVVSGLMLMVLSGMPRFAGANISGPGNFFPGRKPVAGMFLVASKGMRDPRFRKTVILLTKHDKTGTIGFIINRPTKFLLSDVFPGTGRKEPAPHLFVGGPVHPSWISMLIQTGKARPGMSNVMGGVYLIFGTGRVTDIMADMSSTDALRVFTGYSGWAPGQLESEIRRGEWYVMPGDPLLIFKDSPRTIWQELIEKLDGRWT